MKNIDNITKYEINEKLLTINFLIEDLYFAPYGIFKRIQETFYEEKVPLKFQLFKKNLLETFKLIKNSPNDYNFPLNIKISLQENELNCVIIP